MSHPLDPHADPAPGLGRPSPDLPEPIGPYRLVELLGEGGMGVVYRAEQSEPVRREVALKILKAGMDTERVVARFQAERQTLAVMEHPSIARVFDAGATAAGRPYFVMELVRGDPLTLYSDRNRLTVRERVALFLQVCRAVQHAHQKGVVHRDLKPSNILVTEEAEGPLVKVIDFGIARAVEESEDGGTRLTRADEVIGTPAYMSPEQIEGGAGRVDTRSDIYALGVVLYELVAGTLPLDVESYRGLAGVMAALVQDAPRPSRRLAQLPDTQETVAALRRSDPRNLRSELSGDLDWIVLRAMDREPDRRYATANGLAMELERYLAHEPVLARPPSVTYRAGKFVRRHRAATALGVTLVLFLAGFAAVQTVQAERIRQARDLADARREQAEGLVDFMLGDLRAKLEPLGRLDVLDDVGAAALDYFAALPVEEFSDQELLSRSRALYQIGQVRIREGRAQEAREALQESLRLVRTLSERAPDDAERLFELSQARFWVGYAAWREGDLDAAEVQFLGYLEAAERMVQLEPSNADYRMEVGYAHSNLGSVRESRGDLEGAGEAYLRALESHAGLVGDHPGNVDWIGNLAETHNTLGVVYRKLARYAEALEHHRQERELKDRLLGIEPGHAYWRYRRAMAHHFTGRLQLLTGSVGEALASHRTASQTMDSMVALDPANAEWGRQAGMAYRELGTALAASGRREAALDAFTRARRNLEAQLGDGSDAFDLRLALGAVESSRARALQALGEPRAALEALDRADELLAEIGPDDLRFIDARVESLLARGGASEALGREDEARTARERALELSRTGPGEGGDAGLRPLLAEAYLVLGRTAEARGILDLLWEQGYREPWLVSVAEERGLGP